MARAMSAHHTQNTFLARGHVISGRGLASKHLAEHKSTIQEEIGAEPSDGSLNVVLDRPLLLRNSSALSLGEKNGRLLWQASACGVPVWVYRYPGIAEHIIELISEQHLRTSLGLQDGDDIEILLKPEDIIPMTRFRRLVWTVIWFGRRDLYYTSDKYVSRSNTVLRMLGKIRGRGSRRVRALTNTARQDLASILLQKISHPKSAEPFVRIPLNNAKSDTERSLRQLRNLLNYTKTSGTSYAATAFPAGYHTITLGDTTLRGQRDPRQRLELVPLSFDELSILDLGCNQGGMLFALEDSLYRGVGVDFDARMVNAANRIKSVRGGEKLDFYVFDLEKDPLDLLYDLVPQGRVDIVFLLAVCMWIENWREVVDFAACISDQMLFESNGTPDQQQSQIDHLKSVYRNVAMLAGESRDDPGQTNRMLYLCSEPTG